MSNVDTLQYRIAELREDPNGEVWARIKIEKPEDQGDIAMPGALQELERRCAPYGMLPSEALNWMLGHPELDEFFAKIVAHKKKILQ